MKKENILKRKPPKKKRKGKQTNKNTTQTFSIVSASHSHSSHALGDRSWRGKKAGSHSRHSKKQQFRILYICLERKCFLFSYPNWFIYLKWFLGQKTMYSTRDLHKDAQFSGKSTERFPSSYSAITIQAKHSTLPHRLWQKFKPWKIYSILPAIFIRNVRFCLHCPLFIGPLPLTGWKHVPLPCPFIHSALITPVPPVTWKAPAE